MTDIISQLKSTISSELLSGVAKSVGEQESNVSKALGGIFPVLLGGIMKQATSSNSSDVLGGLMGLLKDAPSTKALTSDPTGLLGLLGALGGQGNLVGTAAKFMSMFFGDKADGIVGLISKVAGIKGSSASSLLSMAIPLVLGQLGGKAKESNLNAAGLMSYLGSQKESIISAAPAGLSSVLGLGSLDQLGANLMKDSTKAIGAVGGVAKKGASFLKPALLVGALLLGALFAWKACTPQNTIKEVGQAVSEKTTEVTQVVIPEVITQIDDAATEAATEVTTTAQGLWAHLGKFFSFTLPNGVKLSIPELGVENKLLAFIADAGKPADKTTWFSFDRLVFETGSATLKADSNEQLKNIAEILKAYPAVALKIGGYTDNTGTPEGNLQLSQNRADSVKKELLALGIAADRIETEGYGQEHPIATNDTEEGRAQNRRIDVRVASK